MELSTHLKIAKAVRAILLVSTALLVASFLRDYSHAYCHGGSAEARSWYCETAYRNEDGYRALQ